MNSTQPEDNEKRTTSNGETSARIPKTSQHSLFYLGDFIENLFDAFIATDIDFKITEWNRAAEALYGWAADEVKGRSLLDLVKTEYLEGDHASAFQKIMEEGVWSNKVLQRRKSGTRISVFSTVSVIKNEANEVIGLVAINRNITEQKLAEERFRLAVESAPNAIIMVNQSGDIILVNSQAEKYFGYPRQELIGNSVDRLVPIQYAGIHHEHRAEFLSSPQMRNMGVGRDLYALRKDGSEFPVEIGLAPIETHEGTFVLATIVDITERKLAEERFRLAVESAPNAIIMVNQSGNIILVNSQAEKYFGYQRHELIGNSVDRLVPLQYKAIHPGHRTDFLINPEMRSMGVGRDLYALRKDGREFPVEIGLAPINTHEGTFVLATIVDITERKQAEEEMNRLNKELEAFAYSVSHDLRAPLRGIGGFSGVLTQKYSDCLDEQGLHYLARIQANVQHMGQMIEDLLLLAKMTRHEVRRENVNLSAIAKDVLDELMSQEPERKIKIEIEEQVQGQCDAGLVRILLQNLLGNSWKFTSKRNEALIQFGRTVQQTRNGKMVYFVRDNGAGFDMTYAGKLFGAFQRLHTVHEFPGTGIGLATVQRIVHRHGGEIWAEAALDQGATFFFTLGGFHEQ